MKRIPQFVYAGHRVVLSHVRPTCPIPDAPKPLRRNCQAPASRPSDLRVHPENRPLPAETPHPVFILEGGGDAA